MATWAGAVYFFHLSSGAEEDLVEVADLEVEAEEDSADSVVVVVSAAAAPADLGDPWRA